MRDIIFVIIYGLIILFICSQRAIPVVHINISADATDRPLTGILPHLIAAIIVAGGTPFRHPTVPVFKNRICQVVVPPVQACIYTNIITLGAHNITEDPGNFRQTAVTQYQLTVFLQIIEYRQIRIMPLQQTNRMSGFVHSHIRRHRIGVEIYAVGDAQPLTFRNIAGPLLIVLFRQVHAISAADDSEIHTGSFHCIPVNHTLMMAHINAPVAAGRKRAHTIRQIKAQGIHLRVNALAILITPAILLTGLGQLIQPAFSLCLQGHAHIFHCNLRIGQLGHHILQLGVGLAILRHFHRHSRNGVDLFQAFFQLLLCHFCQGVALFQQIFNLLLQLFFGYLTRAPIRHNGRSWFWRCSQFRGCSRFRCHGRLRGCSGLRSRGRLRGCSDLRSCGRFRGCSGLRHNSRLRGRSDLGLLTSRRLLRGHSTHNRGVFRLCFRALPRRICRHTFLLQLRNDLLRKRAGIILRKNTN